MFTLTVRLFGAKWITKDERAVAFQRELKKKRSVTRVKILVVLSDLSLI